MSVIKTLRTYVLYIEKEKLAVSEENLFEKYQEEHADEVNETSRQAFLFPQVGILADTDDLSELIPDQELRLSFINKAINSKLVLYVNSLMKKAETVKTVGEDGKEETSLRPLFVESKNSIDLTEIVGAAPRRERLTADVKIKRILGDMSPEDQAKFLHDLLAGLSAENETEEVQ